MIFRTYGYDHPEDSCFCDLEYAPEILYKSNDPRAIRENLHRKYYKFYFDKGLLFAFQREPLYKVYHKSLNRDVVGVIDEQIAEVMRPEERLKALLNTNSDLLISSCIEIINLISDVSNLSSSDFGIFGSISHGFHNPSYSDIDLIIYGEKELQELRTVLNELFEHDQIKNEFDGWKLTDPPNNWNFMHLSKAEYGRLQERKLIYAVYNSEKLNREIKVEFEPVRKWNEITNEYAETTRITDLGRVEAVGEILSSVEGGFMPSVYPITLESIDVDIECEKIKRVVSYIEEFRLQLKKGETAFVRGNLERVDKKEQFYQITLSYREDYFDQVLKPLYI